VNELEKERIMHEVHEGVCGSHIEGRSVAVKILRASFFLPTVRDDCLKYVKKCDKCEKHSNDIKVPGRAFVLYNRPMALFQMGGLTFWNLSLYQ